MHGAHGSRYIPFHARGRHGLWTREPKVDRIASVNLHHAPWGSNPLKGFKTHGDKSMEHQMETIYGLFDPREPTEIRYIGKCKSPIEHRLRWHHETARAPSAPVQWWLKELRDCDLRPGATEIARVPDEYGRTAEAYWINHYRTLGHRLLNVIHNRSKVVST